MTKTLLDTSGFLPLLLLMLSQLFLLLSDVVDVPVNVNVAVSGVMDAFDAVVGIVLTAAAVAVVAVAFTSVNNDAIVVANLLLLQLT